MASIIPGYEYDISLRPDQSGLRLTSLHQVPPEERKGEGEKMGIDKRQKIQETRIKKYLTERQHDCKTARLHDLHDLHDPQDLHD